MATKTLVTMTDDLDPEVEATETVFFALDGQAYKIDLSDEHAADLRERLALYVAHASKDVPAPRKGKSTSGSGNSEAAAIRTWAREQGIEVSERGRVGSIVTAQYRAAHPNGVEPQPESETVEVETETVETVEQEPEPTPDAAPDKPKRSRK